MSDLLTASERDAIDSLVALQDRVAITSTRLQYCEVGKYALLFDLMVKKTLCLGDFACATATININRTPYVDQSFKMYVNVQSKDKHWVEFYVEKMVCKDMQGVRVSEQFFYNLPALIADAGGILSRMTVDSRLIDSGQIIMSFRVKTSDGKYVDSFLRCKRMRA